MERVAKQACNKSHTSRSSTVRRFFELHLSPSNIKTDAVVDFFLHFRDFLRNFLSCEHKTNRHTKYVMYGTSTSTHIITFNSTIHSYNYTSTR